MDIRIERTYTMLEEALQEISKEKNIEDVSVSEICERSTVRRATFYRHFEDKYDFCRWYLKRVTKKFLAELTDMGQIESDEDVESYVLLMHRQLVRYCIENEESARNILGRNATLETIEMVTYTIAIGILDRICIAIGKDPVFSEDPSSLDSKTKFAVASYSSGMVYTLRKWLAGDLDITEDELVRYATDNLLVYLKFTGAMED